MLSHMHRDDIFQHSGKYRKISPIPEGVKKILAPIIYNISTPDSHSQIVVKINREDHGPLTGM